MVHVKTTNHERNRTSEAKTRMYRRSPNLSLASSSQHTPPMKDRCRGMAAADAFVAPQGTIRSGKGKTMEKMGSHFAEGRRVLWGMVFVWIVVGLRSGVDLPHFGRLAAAAGILMVLLSRSPFSHPPAGFQRGGPEIVASGDVWKGRGRMFSVWSN